MDCCNEKSPRAYGQVQLLQLWQTDLQVYDSHESAEKGLSYINFHMLPVTARCVVFKVTKTSSAKFTLWKGKEKKKQEQDTI